MSHLNSPTGNYHKPGRLAGLTMPCLSAVVWLTLATLAGNSLSAAEQPDAWQELAVRLCDLALARLEIAQVPNLLQCAALLEAASRTDPLEPRYLRLLADARFRLGDMPGTTQALVAFRRLRPADQTAQLELIDLYLRSIQTLNGKLAYLDDLLSRPGFAPEVRSALAANAAALLMEAGKDQQARAMAERALKDNPLNIAALRICLRLATDAPPPARAALLLATLRANPAQPDIILELARLLARAGLVRESLTWYELVAGPGAPAEVLLEYAAQLLIYDQIFPASELLEVILRNNPENYDALALRIISEKRKDPADPAVLDKLANQARNCLLNRLASVRSALGIPGATTRPVDQPVAPAPDLSKDIAAWNSSNDASTKQAYLNALADLAWFDIYFTSRTEDAEQILKHLLLLAASGEPAAARIAGWLFLIRGRIDEARVKLAAVAQEDPLAAVGLVRTFGPGEEPQRQARQTAQRLLQTHPAGPLGAVLQDGVRSVGAKVVGTEHAAAIRKNLAKFRDSWLHILDNPQSFYLLRCEPLKPSWLFGQPILVRLSIRNLSDNDLTLGPDGVIRPDMVIEARVREADKDIGAFGVVERFTDQLVLRARQSITRVVRLDQGRLGMFLANYPASRFSLALTLRSNVAQLGLSAPAGYATTPPALVERQALLLNDPKVLQETLDAAAATSSQRRLQALDTLVLFDTGRRSAPDSSVSQQAQAITEALRKLREDPDPAVQCWALFKSALYSPQQQTVPLTQRLLGHTVWQARALGVLLLCDLATEAPPPVSERKKKLLSLQQEDPDSTVRALAGAGLQLLERPPTTQPGKSDTEDRPMRTRP